MKKIKECPQKKILSGFVTKLENLFVSKKGADRSHFGLNSLSVLLQMYCTFPYYLSYSMSETNSWFNILQCHLIPIVLHIMLNGDFYRREGPFLSFNLSRILPSVLDIVLVTSVSSAGTVQHIHISMLQDLTKQQKQLAFLGEKNMHFLLAISQA